MSVLQFMSFTPKVAPLVLDTLIYHMVLSFWEPGLGDGLLLWCLAMQEAPEPLPHQEGCLYKSRMCAPILADHLLRLL